MTTGSRRTVHVPCGDVTLEGTLIVPDGASGVVAFAHGSGSSRFSPRNVSVAEQLNAGGLGTLLVDLLSEEEERAERLTAHLRFDIPMLAARVTEVTRWLAGRHGPIGLFGASTGAAAALAAAAEEPDLVAAVVSRGGRPDLAEAWLARVRAPTLLIVGGADTPVIEMNRSALERLHGVARLEIVPGATHLFEEPGTLERVAELARAWFEAKLG